MMASFGGVIRSSSSSSRDSSSTCWRQAILHSLQQRNKRQCQCFHDLITAHARLFENADALKAENLHLTVQNERLRLENADLHCGGGGGGGGGENRADVKSNERAMALEMKLFRLQEELTELHRRKGENAQALIDLRSTLQEKEAEIATKDVRLRESDSNLLAMKEIQKSLEQKIREFEAANQMLKDEHQALQLAFNGLQEQYRTIQMENRELVERWMKQKALDADRLNDENEIVLKLPSLFPSTSGISRKCSKLLRILTPSTKRLKLQKELDEAARDPVVVDPLWSVHSTIPNTLDLTRDFALLKLKSSDRSVCPALLDAHDGEVQAVKWGPKGHLIATGGTDRKVKLWELVKGSVEQRGILRGSNAAVTSVDFDTDEELVLGTSNDFASRVWTVSDQRLRHTLTGHSGRVLAAKFLGESTKVVSGSHDRTLKIWDLRSLACIRTVFTGSSCNDVVTDRPGSTIISGHFDKRIRFWDTRKESTANEVVLQGKVTSLDISPDGCHLLSCVRDNTLKLLDLRMNQVIGTFYAEGFWVAFDWTRAVFTPDGQYVTAGSQDGTIFVWNISDPTQIKTLKEHTHAVAACSWQCTGSSLVSCDRNKHVVIWSAS